MAEQWTPEIIADRFEECVSVLRNLPNGLTLGYNTYWPEVTYTPKELARQERKKINTLRPLPDAIDRADETLSWITWVNHGERNLIWLRAHRISWRGIARETGFPRSSAQRYWRDALTKVVVRLENI